MRHTASSSYAHGQWHVPRGWIILGAALLSWCIFAFGAVSVVNLFRFVSAAF